jgi:dephospho-CoA kinase
VIGFAGPAGAGKSSAAGVLAMHGFSVLSVADPLRALALDLHPEWSAIDLTGPGKDVRPVPDAAVAHRLLRGPGLSPRETLRVLGDHLRGLAPGALVDHLANRIDAALSEGRSVVVDDIRMLPEAVLIRCVGTLVHIHREGVTHRRDHATEIPLEVESRDLVMRNPGTVQGLATEVHQMMSELRRRQRVLGAAA